MSLKAPTKAEKCGEPTSEKEAEEEPKRASSVGTESGRRTLDAAVVTGRPLEAPLLSVAPACVGTACVP